MIVSNIIPFLALEFTTLVTKVSVDAEISRKIALHGAYLLHLGC